jgi:hypothetical protein
MNGVAFKRMGVVVSVLFAAVLGVGAGEARAAGSELIDMLTKSLGVTPAQASGGAGSLFAMAKSQLKPEDFSKIAAVVPGMDSLLKSAPKAEGTASSLESMMGSAGGMAGVLDQFKALGLSPDMVGKFVPAITKFVESKGGSALSSLLAGVWA